MQKEYLKRYKKNIRFLKREKPELYKKLMQQNYDTNYNVTVDFTDGPRLFLDGKIAMDNFDKKLDSIYPELQNRLKKRYIDVSINFNSEYWDKSLHFEILRKIKNYYDKHKTANYIQSNHIPMMLIYGVGFGFHIEKILRDFRVYNMILIDQDIELIRPSLYTLDWEELFQNVNIDIAVARDEEKLATSIYKNIKKLNELYIHYYEEYILYQSPLFFKTQEYLSEKRYSLGDNWGFFDDEYVSLKHTFQNIEYAPAFYVKKKDYKGDVPVFIIGSGPSLDESIEVIKKYQDKVVIFSCGTALKPLLQNGIWPDYEFILERTEPPYIALRKTLTEEELKKLKIIAVNLVYPKIFEVKENRYMVLRGHDTGSLLFDAKYATLHNLAPTVTNLAFSFALDFGFRQVYLFGIDLGVKGEKHHSKDSVYYTEEEFDISKKYPIKIEGNFGGEVYTDDILFQTKLSFERNIKIFSDRYVYNCSDGGKIEGAYSLRPQKVFIDGEDKAETIREIENVFNHEFFTSGIQKDIFSNYEEFVYNFTVLKRYFRLLFSQIHTVKDIYERSDHFYRKLKRYIGDKPTIGYFFQASLFHQLSYLLLTLYGVSIDEKIFYFKQGISFINNYLNEIERRLQSLLKKR